MDKTNRLKAFLAEQGKGGKWLAEQLGKILKSPEAQACPRVLSNVIHSVEETNKEFNSENTNLISTKMVLINDKEYNGFNFRIMNESLEQNWNEEDLLLINLRVTNKNDLKKKICVKIKYISVTCGLKKADIPTLGFGSYDGNFLQPQAFVDLKITVEGVSNANDGDRMELDVNEGKIATLLLKRENARWYVIEEKSISSVTIDLKKRIEHFDYIEEKFGIMLQKFSVIIQDENSFYLFCEVLARDGIVPTEGFTIEVAIYDMDDNIVEHDSKEKFDNEFTGFEVFSFGRFRDIPIETISKIRFYPIR